MYQFKECKNASTENHPFKVALISEGNQVFATVYPGLLNGQLSLSHFSNNSLRRFIITPEIKYVCLDVKYSSIGSGGSFNLDIITTMTENPIKSNKLTPPNNFRIPLARIIGGIAAIQLVYDNLSALPYIASTTPKSTEGGIDYLSEAIMSWSIF